MGRYYRCMVTLNLYLIRHAESEWNAIGRWQGQADPPLSDRGMQQAAGLAAGWAHPIDTIFSSDLERAAQTAHPLAAARGLDVQHTADLRELDVGSWSGLTRDEIQVRYPGALERYFLGEAAWEGGESHEQHARRVRRFLKSVMESAPRDRDDEPLSIAAVTHGGTLRAIVVEALGLRSNSDRWLGGVGHTSITHLTRDSRGWRLAGFNRPVV